VVSAGYRAYLALPDVESVTEGHVLIVPMQHHLSMLEADSDTWDEVKNFIKCLVRMWATQARRVVFYETLLSLKPQAHAVLEAVAVAEPVFAQLPGVFKQSLRMAGAEFSTHRKLIEFTPQRPFRAAMVPHLPYFAVSWDPNFTTGYGHIIENPDRDTTRDADPFDVDEMAAGPLTGSAAFDRLFARDLIASVIQDVAADSGTDAPDRVYGKPRRRSESAKLHAKSAFEATWKPFDWTRQLTDA
jgi:hypothetical protein